MAQKFTERIHEPTESEDSNDTNTTENSQAIPTPTPFGINLQLIDHDDDDDDITSPQCTPQPASEQPTQRYPVRQSRLTE